MRRAWRLIGSVGVLLIVLGCFAALGSAHKAKHAPKIKDVKVSSVTAAAATISGIVEGRGHEVHWEIFAGVATSNKGHRAWLKGETIAEGTIPAGTPSAQVEAVWLHGEEPLPEFGEYAYKIVAEQTIHEGVIKQPKH